LFQGRTDCEFNIKAWSVEFEAGLGDEFKQSSVTNGLGLAW